MILGGEKILPTRYVIASCKTKNSEASPNFVQNVQETYMCKIHFRSADGPGKREVRQHPDVDAETKDSGGMLSATLCLTR